MPDQCLACHADETSAWAQSFFPQREGFGTGAAGYAGSARCLGCHEDLYLGWQDTHHALSIQNATTNPEAVEGDFEIEHPDRPFGLADVAYTIGGIRQQKYITHTVEGGFFVLPAQWKKVSEEWVPYHTENWEATDWRESCSGCHVTGLDTEKWEFTEFGIGCESCHGPSLEHSQNPEETRPFAEVDDQVCGACHSRGESPDGLPFPTTYHPGDVLTEHFTFTDDPNDLWPDGSARMHTQQYTDWQFGSTMSLAASTSCISCHKVHEVGNGPGQLVKPLNEVCLECHNDKRKIVQHMPYHEVASRTNDFTCADCHMPKMATSAEPFDSRSHTFLQPNPQGSIDHGGVEVMPNACNLCHADHGDDPEWAIETIAYSSETQPQNDTVFGPGATPTSPPPPTPVPSVGQPVETVHDAPGGWLRTSAFVAAGLVMLLIVLAIGAYVRTRSTGNV